MGLGVPESVYNLVCDALIAAEKDPASYEIEFEEGLYFIPIEAFEDINWEYDENTGGLYNLNLRPSQEGYLIGNY